MRGDYIELECPCCGTLGARYTLSDDQELLCGCAGHVSLDREAAPEIVIKAGGCPPGALCRSELDSEKDRKVAALREIEAEELELAYWEFDALRKRPRMPMAERDAFKAAARGLIHALDTRNVIQRRRQVMKLAIEFEIDRDDAKLIERLAADAGESLEEWIARVAVVHSRLVADGFLPTTPRTQLATARPQGREDGECDLFMGGDRMPFADCEGDGHYQCRECVHHTERVGDGN